MKTAKRQLSKDDAALETTKRLESIMASFDAFEQPPRVMKWRSDVVPSIVWTWPRVMLYSLPSRCGSVRRPGSLNSATASPWPLAESQTKCPEAGAVIVRSAMERAIVACFYGSGVDGPFLVACFYGSGASTGRSRSRSGLGSCGGCCASNGAIFRHPGCPLVLFVLTETVIEYAGRRAARYGAAMRQHVREGTELLVCDQLISRSTFEATILRRK